VAFSPNGHRLAVGDVHGLLQVWDAKAGEPLYPPTDAGLRPWSGPIVYADPAGWLAYPTFSNTVQIKVWKEGTQTSTIWLPQPQFGIPAAVAMTPDAARIAIASARQVFLQPGELTTPVVVYDISPIEDPVAVGEALPEPQARPSFEQYQILLMALAPKYAEPFKDAQKQVLQGEDNQAIESIRVGLSLPGLQPESAEEANRLVAGLIRALGERLAQEGKVEEAIATFERARAIDPTRTQDSPKLPTTLAAQSYLSKAHIEAARAVTVASGRVTVDEAQLAKAVELLRQAKQWDPAQVQEPEVRAKVFVAQTLANQVMFLARQGKNDDALAACVQARKFEEKPGSLVTAYILNALCWWGSLHGHVEKVKFAGNEAVTLAPMNPRYKDTRGLARALTGDLKGAADDFEVYATWKDAPKQQAEKRRRWVESLRAGKNPFTPDVLRGLRTEG
jgi:tetratricopeptide (TPR) repeat protein